MSSEVETSLDIHSALAAEAIRDLKPGRADFVRCVAASTPLGMTEILWQLPKQLLPACPGFVPRFFVAFANVRVGWFA
jgi:hypothetical protein